MGDLINRKEAMDAIMNTEPFVVEIHGEQYVGQKTSDVMDALASLPSAEPEERTAKVIEHDASITDTDGYKYYRTECLCGNCKKKVLSEDDYCSHCGARLEWDHE